MDVHVDNDDANESSHADKPSIKVVINEAEPKSRAGLYLLIILALMAWCGGGLIMRGRFLEWWHDDYFISSQARAHPFIARLVAPEPAVQAAEEFTADYEELQRSNLFTAGLYCFESYQSHKRLLQALNGEQKQQQQGDGIRVDTITPGSNAERGGLRVGDIIYSYHGTPISTNAQLQAARDAAQRDPLCYQVVVLVQRSGSLIQLTLSTGLLGITTTD